MGIVGVVVGLAVIGLVLLDGFEAMVLPRRVTRNYRPARLYYQAAWRGWRFVGCRLGPGKFRETWLSFFGPLSLLGLLVLWVLALVLGFALMNWGLGTIAPDDDGDATGFGRYVYMSGTTISTLGYGDVTPVTWAGRALAIVEAGVGFGFLAVVIGYLPVVYQAFSRREVAISLLDARAGSPPSAAEAVLRLARANHLPAVNPLLAEWEQWAAELLESHLSFPVLSYYRSQHDNQSWLAAHAMILDTCALLLAAVKGADRYQARLTFAMARHAAVDLALIFRHPPHPPAPDRLPPERLAKLRAALREAGAELHDEAEAAAALAELRAAYEPFLAGLADYFLLTLPPVWPEKPAVDNWQTSAWMRRLPGFGQLPAPADDDHFD